MVEQIENNFTYPPPKNNQVERNRSIRDKAKSLAFFIHHSCPESREKSLAMTKLEETVMWALAAVARNE